jgi:hypothetical protein
MCVGGTLLLLRCCQAVRTGVRRERILLIILLLLVIGALAPLLPTNEAVSSVGRMFWRGSLTNSLYEPSAPSEPSAPPVFLEFA